MLAFPVKFFQLAVCLKMFTVKYWGQGQQLCGALGSPGGDAGVLELRLAGTVSLISMAAPTDAFLRPPFTGRTPSPGSLTPGLPGLELRMPHFWPPPPPRVYQSPFSAEGHRLLFRGCGSHLGAGIQVTDRRPRNRGTRAVKQASVGPAWRRFL